MKKVIYSIPLEPNLIEQAEKTFERIGVNFNDAISDFLQKMIKDHEFSYETKERTYSVVEPKSLRQLIEDRTGMNFEAYLKCNPFNPETDYVEFERIGNEII